LSRKHFHVSNSKTTGRINFTFGANIHMVYGVDFCASENIYKNAILETAIFTHSFSRLNKGRWVDTRSPRRHRSVSGDTDKQRVIT